MLRKCGLFFSLRPKYKLPQRIRKKVWDHYVGPAIGEIECFCCEETLINPFEFECAHVVAEAKGGCRKIENLRPCCKDCNRSMGTQNFFVFKSIIHDKINIDRSIRNKKYIDHIIAQHIFNSNSYSDDQKNIFQFYDQVRCGVTCGYYMTYFDEWLKILRSSMFYKKNNLNDEMMHYFECRCTYSFNYVTKNNDFELSCRNAKQNLLDVIYDHRLCLIRNEKFLVNVLKSKSFKKWCKEEKKSSKKFFEI